MQQLATQRGLRRQLGAKAPACTVAWVTAAHVRGKCRRNANDSWLAWGSKLSERQTSACSSQQCINGKTNIGMTPLALRIPWRLIYSLCGPPPDPPHTCVDRTKLPKQSHLQSTYTYPLAMNILQHMGQRPTSEPPRQRVPHRAGKHAKQRALQRCSCLNAKGSGTHGRPNGRIAASAATPARWLKRKVCRATRPYY